jgi:hypothetical protein
MMVQRTGGDGNAQTPANSQHNPHRDVHAGSPEPHKAPGSVNGLVSDLLIHYGHNPQAYRHDLKEATKFVGTHGFPGVHIEGVQGHDLVGKKTDGSIVFIGDNHHGGARKDRECKGGTKDVTTPSGHKAKLAADGAGTYTATGKDNGWTLSRDILQDRMKKGKVNGKPTTNQIGNFMGEMGAANGADWSTSLYEGKEVKVPPTVIGGDAPPAIDCGTSACEAGKEQTKPGDGAEDTQKRAQAERLAPSVEQIKQAMTPEIEAALKRNGLETDPEKIRKGIMDAICSDTMPMDAMQKRGNGDFPILAGYMGTGAIHDHQRQEILDEQKQKRAQWRSENPDADKGTEFQMFQTGDLLREHFGTERIDAADALLTRLQPERK